MDTHKNVCNNKVGSLTISTKKSTVSTPNCFKMTVEIYNDLKTSKEIFNVNVDRKKTMG